MITKPNDGRDKSLILVVDDSEINVTILKKMLLKQGYLVDSCYSAIDALEYLRHNKPDLIVSDISMPEMDGYELCKKIKSVPEIKDIPLIFISALNEKEEKMKGFELGAADFIGKPFQLWEVNKRIDIHLEYYKMKCALAENNKRMHHMVREQSSRIENEHRSMLTVFADLVEERDENASLHNDHVGYNSRLLAQALQFTPKYEKQISTDFIDYIEIAAKTHDIGKLLISEDILLKETKLTSDELLAVRSHCENGAKILKRLNAVSKNEGLFNMATRIALYHHERWDGKGYPKQLAGEDIPLEARIVGLVGTFDTLTGIRCYKDAMSSEEAFEIIKRDAGTFFDPDMVEVFLKIKRKLRLNSSEENELG